MEGCHRLPSPLCTIYSVYFFRGHASLRGLQFGSCVQLIAQGLRWYPSTLQLFYFHFNQNSEIKKQIPGESSILRHCVWSSISHEQGYLVILRLSRRNLCGHVRILALLASIFRRVPAALLKSNADNNLFENVHMHKNLRNQRYRKSKFLVLMGGGSYLDSLRRIQYIYIFFILFFKIS